MNKVRFGLVGTGGVGHIHLNYMKSLPRAEITCVCDNRAPVVEAVARNFGVQAFTDPDKLIESGLCDAVLIATPHFLHPVVAVAAMNAGLHVLTEKPMAVRVSEADRMIAAAKRNKVKLAVVFQRRLDPLWVQARKIVDSGALGRLIRTCLIESWFRPQAYYDSASWRGTWSGEGGGVMMNQSSHSLDALAWLGGMPEKVTGKVATRAHKIEVEDVATAMLSYKSGAVGLLHTSTFEFPEPTVFQFVGDSAVLEIREGMLRIGTSAPSAGEFVRTATDPWGLPVPAWKEIKIESPPGPHGHEAIAKNFVDAVLDGVPLAAPGEEAIKSLELANAISVSSDLGREVTLPLVRKLFDDFLAKKIRGSKGKKDKDAPDKVVIPGR
jgi:predicted dehydrogenase